MNITHLRMSYILYSRRSASARPDAKCGRTHFSNQKLLTDVDDLIYLIFLFVIHYWYILVYI